MYNWRRVHGVAIPLLVLALGMLAITAAARGRDSQPLPNEPDRFDGTTESAAPGDVIDIKFSNPQLANKKVSVLAAEQYEEEWIEIQLDGNGNGRVRWRIPDGWDGAFLSHPTSIDHAILVLD